MKRNYHFLENNIEALVLKFRKASSSPRMTEPL